LSKKEKVLHQFLVKICQMNSLSSKSFAVVKHAVEL